MVSKIKIYIIFFFAISVCASVFVFEVCRQYFGYTFQTYALSIMAICVGAIFISFGIDLIITLPLKDFKKKLHVTWNEKNTLPDPATIPRIVAPLTEIFAEIVLDIQNKMKTLGEMQQLDNAKYEFIAIANHQLRTPITEISWAIGALHDSPLVGKESETKELIEKIENGVSRITVIVNQFLAVAEMSMNKSGIEQVVINIGDLVKKSVSEVSGIAKQKNMDIVLTVHSGIAPLASGDPRLFGFVFETLLINAVNYGIKDTQIQVTIKNKKNMTEISVDNEGQGLVPEEIPKLFEKFFRGMEAKRVRPDGSGLALYLTKRIVDQFGGTIAVQTEVSNHTTFVVSFPLSSKGEMAQFVGNY